MLWDDRGISQQIKNVSEQIKQFQDMFENILKTGAAELQKQRAEDAYARKIREEKQVGIDAHNEKVFANNELAFKLNAQIESMMPRQVAALEQMEKFLSKHARPKRKRKLVG